MVGVLHQQPSWSPQLGFTLSIYDVVAGVCMHLTHPITSSLCHIWTHGEFLRMALAESTTVTILEVGFSPGVTCVEIGTLSIPENVGLHIHHMQAQFLPASCRLALVYAIGSTRKVLVWSLRDPKCLVYQMGLDTNASMEFSSDGCSFAYYQTRSAEVHIWKETSTGYTLHAKLPAAATTPHLSPNGESLVTICNSAIQLWHVKNFTITPSNLPTKVPHRTTDFLLDFFLDRPLAVFMRQRHDTVTVLDLESGLTQLTIQTSLEAYGLTVIGDTIVVISGERAIAWKLPRGIAFPDGRIGVEHSTQTTNLIADYDAEFSVNNVISASISPDLRYIAILKEFVGRTLCLYDASSGQLLTRERIEWRGGPLSFTPDGLNICCFLHEGVGMVKITRGGPLDNPIMTPATNIEDGSWRCPLGAPGGHQVTDDGWILSTDRKRLLMLPPPWQSHANKQVWNGQFLALLHGSLPELVILELEL